MVGNGGMGREGKSAGNGEPVGMAKEGGMSKEEASAYLKDFFKLLDHILQFSKFFDHPIQGCVLVLAET